MAEVVEAQVVPASIPTLVSRPDPFQHQRRELIGKNADRFDKQSQTLGAQIDQTDERVAEQIHATFDHQLGQFDASTSFSDDATRAASAAERTAAETAASLRQALANRADIRRAIVMSEILNPPMERW
jgi:hypothetical protein